MAWLTRLRPSPKDDARAAEFERLFREHIAAFHRDAYRWTGSVDRAEDLVQELLVRLYPRLDELRRIEKIRPWALRVMYRIFVDDLRRRRSSPVQYGTLAGSGTGEDDIDAPIDEAGEPPALTEQQLSQERLLRAWEQLGEDHRVVLSMHDIEGYGLAEISDITGAPVGTLKSRLHRARARLRELLVMEHSGRDDRV